jgi:luciferase-type oxidoreductase
VKSLFPNINQGYNRTFRADKLTLGVIIPIERYTSSAVPTMQQHIERVQLVEQLGFSAVWLRDVPFNVPSFGDAGQTFDPFVYLGVLAAQTQTISLGVASLILPLRHPAHVAKAAASVDVLSNGRLLLGIASGDRPEEYPAMNMTFDDRGARFRSSVAYIEKMWEPAASFTNEHGSPYGGMDMLPKPTGSAIPLLITGGSQQDPDWIARNGHGWITYPRNAQMQQRIIEDWRNRVQAVGGPLKPAVQSLYIDLVDDVDAEPQPIHLGFRSGVNYLSQYLKSLREIGINHVGLNLRFNQADIEATLKRLATDILPEFS